MKELSLTNHSLPALVDDEDYERLRQFLWYTRSKTSDCIHRTVNNMFRSKHIPLANEVMQEFVGMYDHKDRNKFNNQKDNLRACTWSDNIINRPKYENTTSRYKGVTYHKINKRWSVVIQKDKKRFYLGCFDTEEEGAKAYDKKAKELHGEFAVLNFPTTI